MKQQYFTRFSKRMEESDAMKKIAEQYQSNYVAISNYIKTLLDKSISDFNIQNPPADWAEYFTLLSEAQAKTKTWTHTIWSDLQSIPSEIAIKGEAVILRFQQISEICADLQKYPSDKILVSEMNDNLELLLKSIRQILDRLELLLTNITAFDGDVVEIAEQLKQIADMALEDKEIDEEKIKDLQKDIRAAKDEISDLAWQIAGASVGLIASVAISVLAFVFTGAAGGFAVSLFLGIPAIVCGVVIATNSVKINALKKSIEIKSESLSRYEADVLQLEMMADEFNKLSEQAVLLKENIKFIYDIWAALYNDLAEINDEVKLIRETISETEIYTSEGWKMLQESVLRAEQEFKTFVEKIQYFDVSEITAIDAQIELGMSSEDVEKLLAEAPKMDLITYLTA